MAAHPIPVTLDERVAAFEAEFRDRFQRARKRARAFEGLSIEAVFIGLALNAFVDWDRVLGCARHAQLDIDEVDVRKKLAAARERERKAWERYCGPTDNDLEKLVMAQRALKRARAEVQRLEVEQERIWQERSK